MCSKICRTLRLYIRLHDRAEKMPIRHFQHTIFHTAYDKIESINMTNSERLFKDILAGKITLVDLRKASNWEEESEKFLSRLNALAQLDVLMDEFLLIYGFSGEKLARQIPPIRTKIDADYLIKFELKEGITFFFSVKQKDTFCGRSIFVNNDRDYSAGQTKFTLLEKTKTKVQTGETTLLYRRDTYRK